MNHCYQSSRQAFGVILETGTTIKTQNIKPTNTKHETAARSINPDGG